MYNLVLDAQPLSTSLIQTKDSMKEGKGRRNRGREGGNRGGRERERKEGRRVVEEKGGKEQIACVSKLAPA